jgi:hypothetical protein
MVDPDFRPQQDHPMSDKASRGSPNTGNTSGKIAPLPTKSSPTSATWRLAYTLASPLPATKSSPARSVVRLHAPIWSVS